MVPEKIRDLIRAFRSSSNELDMGLRANLYGTQVFRSITQAIALQLYSPDIALIFFLTQADKPDLSVEIAAEMSVEDSLTKLESVLERYKNTFFEDCFRAEGGRVSLKEIIEGNVKQLMGRSLIHIGSESTTRFVFWPRPKDMAVYMLVGRIEDVDTEKIVNLESELAQKARAFKPEPLTVFSHTGRRRKIYAARFPKIEVRINVPKTMSNELAAMLLKTDDSMWLIQPPVWKSKFGKTELLVFASGLAVADTRHEKIALESLNSLLAMADFDHIACLPTSLWNLGYVNIGEHGNVESYGGAARQTRTHYHAAVSVSPEVLVRFLNRFQLCEPDGELMAQLRLRHAAGIHLMSGEYLQAMLLAWAVVERELERRWIDVLIKKGVGPKRTEKLSKHDDFTANQLTEMLELLGMIDSEIYTHIQSLRKVRNDVVHRGSTPTLEQSAECIQVANTFISERIEKRILIN